MANGKENRYGGITKEKMDLILNTLRNNGKIVTGGNPWDVDVRTHGIKLRGSWDEKMSVLSLTVTDKNFYVPYSSVWNEIDSLINRV